MTITYEMLDFLTGGKLGTHNVPCPECSPHRRTPAHRRAKVFRIWYDEPGFASYCCVHCGVSGYAQDAHAARSAAPHPAKIAKARAAAAERDREHNAERLAKARGLWSMRKPMAGTIAETYLRDVRGCGGPLPATLGFLPACGELPPAMIAAFGVAHEIEPGVIAIADDAVQGVHLTRLLRDGSDRIRGERGKIMVGRSASWPITLAPPNDLLGLAITEGIETGLSTYVATGLGVWVAGSASRMPALADKVPSYIECVTVVADADGDGVRFATDLAGKLLERGFPEVRVVVTEEVPVASAEAA